MADVLFGEISANHTIGVITLNRQHALNALTPAMVSEIYVQLQAWESSSDVEAVLIKPAPGRAFSAGGDLRILFEHYDDPVALNFFNTEYQLNYLIHRFTKPIIAWMNGITMGGGAGLAVHASHRIGTPTLQFAMPETAIGFFPDVGATYFLPRLPDYWGWYLGLTGNVIDADTSYALGLTTHHSGLDISVVEQILVESKSHILSHAIVSQLLETIHQPLVSLNAMTITADEMKKFFAHKTFIDCWENFAGATSETGKAIFSTLQRKSPLSLHVTFRALAVGATQTLKKTLARETKIALQFMQTRELYEGIRAQMIDKDYQPHWQYQDVYAVSDEIIAPFFV